jgi:3-oxoacyl-[acyl-carrier protein] reductase
MLVTGGARGIGAATCRLGAREGYRVCVNYLRHREAAEAVVRELSNDSIAVAADVAQEPDVLRLFDTVDRELGRIDVLVNNAGVARDGVIATARATDVDAVVDLNVKGTLEITRLVTRRMLAQGGGHIVSISSIVGLSGYRGLAVYSATKAAIDGLTRALARELGSRGIFVNSVAPGYLRTEMSHGLDEEQLEQIVRRTPAGRLGEPEDIARLVMFLTSEDNTYITGQTFVADGGLTA